MKLAEKIKIGVVPRSEVPPKCQGLFLCYLRNVINCCLEVIKSDESLSYHTMRPYFVVKCSACFGKYEECFRHKKYECQHDECRHFWSLEELKPCSDDPICIHSDDVKRREFCLDRVKPWLTIGTVHFLNALYSRLD